MNNFRSNNLKLSPIKKVELIASKIPGVVSLAQGIPSFDTPEPLKKMAIQAIEQGKVAKYSLSPGIIELREVIEQKLAEEKMFYDFDKEIIVTAGSIEAITATFLTILNLGDEVIIPSPTYTSYQEAIKIAYGKPVFVDLDEEKGWAFNIENFKKAITSKTKALLFCNPNNPTGTIYTKEQLLQLMDLARKNNFYIISDEVYKDFVYLEPEKGSKGNKIFSLGQIPEFRKQFIRIFSFSKAYAVTGWRLGFLHTDTSIAHEILKVHDGLVTCAPVVSQYMGIAAFQDADNFIEHYYQEYLKRRDLICQRLNNLSDIFSYQKPNSSYFVFPKILIDHESSEDFCIKILKQAKVATVFGSAFGPNGENHLRMSFGRSEEDINLAFDRLDNYFK